MQSFFGRFAVVTYLKCKYSVLFVLFVYLNQSIGIHYSEKLHDLLCLYRVEHLHAAILFTTNLEFFQCFIGEVLF